MSNGLKNPAESTLYYQASLIDPPFYTTEQLPKKTPEFIEDTPTQISLFELCSQIDAQGLVHREMLKREAEKLLEPTLEDSDPGEFETEEERQIATIQVEKKSEKMLFTIFTRLARKESVSDLFGVEQHKALARNGFNLDDYVFDNSWSAPSVMWKATEIFRYWIASNAKAQRCGLTADMIQMQLQEYINAFEQVIHNKFPLELTPTEFDNPFLDDEQRKINDPPLVEPLILDPEHTTFIPEMTVRLFINDCCVLVPLPPIFFTHKNRICYLNEIGGYPSSAHIDRSYQIGTMLKVVAVGLLFQKAKIPLNENEKLDMKDLKKKIPKLKDLKLSGLLDWQTKNLWDYFKFTIRIRHVYPEHKFERDKKFNFLNHFGLSIKQIEDIDSAELARILEQAIPITTQQKRMIKKNNIPEAQYIETAKGGLRKIKPAPAQKKSRTKRKKRVYDSSIPIRKHDF